MDLEKWVERFWPRSTGPWSAPVGLPGSMFPTLDRAGPAASWPTWSCRNQILPQVPEPRRVQRSGSLHSPHAVVAWLS